MKPRDHEGVLAAVVDALKDCGAIAIGAYGSTAGSNWTHASDVDLVAVLDDDPPVESIRLRVRGVPVDVNLRSADDGFHGIGGASFVPEMTALWDPTGVLANARTTVVAPDPSTARMLRYQLAHSVDKARQLEPSPLARIFGGGEAPFVVRGYFQARALWFPGPVPGLRMLEEREPDLLAILGRIATGPDAPSTYLAAAAELALEPVGGLWRDDEAFVVGWDGAVRRDDAGERWAEQQMAPLLHVADEQRRLA